MKSINERWDEVAKNYNYCIGEVDKRLEKRDFIGAAAFMKNATRHLEEMEGIKKEEADLKGGKVHIIVTQLGMGERFR